MWNEPADDELRKIPALNSTHNVPWQDKLIYQHFFIAACDWYVAEYSSQNRLFFGFAILNADLDNAEWGYFGYDELRTVRVRGIDVDRDLYWQVRRASEIEKIVEAHRRQRQFPWSRKRDEDARWRDRNWRDGSGLRFSHHCLVQFVREFFFQENRHFRERLDGIWCLVQ